MVLVEKGTGFILWSDVVDNLTKYTKQSSAFHTMHVSSDHSKWDLIHWWIPLASLLFKETRSFIVLFYGRESKSNVSSWTKQSCFIFENWFVSRWILYRFFQRLSDRDFENCFPISRRIGLSFDSGEAAENFYLHLQRWKSLLLIASHKRISVGKATDLCGFRLTSDPANIALSGPRSFSKKSGSFGSLVDHERGGSKKYKAPNKSEISLPCAFQHVISVNSEDFKKYFSLQAFVRWEKYLQSVKRDVF